MLLGLLVGEDNTCTKTMTGIYKANNIPGYCTTHVGKGTTETWDTPWTTDPSQPEVTIDLSGIYGTNPTAASSTKP